MNPEQRMSRRRALAFAGAGAGALAMPASATADDRPRRPGIRPIARDTVIAEDLVLFAGEGFDIAEGATLTLTGDLIAPARRLFNGRGRVDLTRSRVTAARPEWWGAIPDDPAVDCLPALDACLPAHVAMQFGPGDYHLSETWKVALPNRRIWGIGRSKGARGTRLVKRGGSGATVLVGTEPQPASINAFLWGVDMRWIELGRDARPVGAPDAIDAASNGLRIRHVVDCLFEGLRANEHAVCYSIHGAVRTYLQDCTAFRSLTSGNGAAELFVGFDLDGRPAALMAGGNASLYLIDCNARTGGLPKLALSAGARLTGAVADTFLVRLETTTVDHGIRIDGQASVLSASERRQGHADLHIQSAVLDGCMETGIYITGLSDKALVDIQTPYIALAAGGKTALALTRSGGNVTVTGGQLIGWPASVAGGTPSGIVLQDSAGAAFHGTKLLGFAHPVFARRSSGFELAVAINADEGADGGPAITLEGCRNGYLRPRLAGRAGAHRSGVAADKACTRITVEATGLDPAMLGGGAAATFDNRPIAPGAAGTMLVTAPSQA